MGMVAHVQQVSATNNGYKQRCFLIVQCPMRNPSEIFYSSDMVAVDLSDAAQEAAMVSTLYNGRSDCLASIATAKADALLGNTHEGGCAPYVLAAAKAVALALKSMYWSNGSRD